MRTMAGFLLRDANVTLNTSEKNRRIEQFVSDAYGQEAKLAKVRVCSVGGWILGGWVGGWVGGGSGGPI